MIIEIAGIDGSGKTTLIKTLKGLLNRRDNLWAYERTFRLRSRRFFELLAMDEGHSRAEDLFDRDMLHVVDALDNLEEAHRALQYSSATIKQVYLLDHYVFEWRSIASDLGNNSLHSVIQKIYDKAPPADLTFLLQCSPTVALQRLESRAGGDQLLITRDPLKSLADIDHRLQLAAQNYCDGQIWILNAESSEEQVCSEALKIIDNFAAQCQKQ